MIKLPNFKTKDGSVLPALLVLFALLAGFIFYFQVIRPGQVNEYEILPEVQREISRFQSFRDIQFNFSVFDRPDFKSLRIFGEAPVKTVPGGKTDLFNP